METKLYGGRVVVRFAEESHIYTVSVDGGKFVRKGSMTAISGVKDKSQFLIPWSQETSAKNLFMALATKKKITEEDIVKAVFSSDTERDAAADLGSKIHDWIEQHIRFKLGQPGIREPDMPADDAVAIGVASFLKWESERKNLEYIWTEKILYSLKHDVVGRGDFAIRADGRTSLCDLKTGNGMYTTVRIQTRGYVEMDMEESGQKYDGRWAIRLAKETEEEYIARMTLKNHIKALLGKPVYPIKPYQVFEAYYLDHNGHEMQDDLQAMFDAMGLIKWDKKAVFSDGPTTNGKATSTETLPLPI